MNALITLCSVGLLGLFSEIFNFKRRLLPIVYAGLPVALYFVFADWNTNRVYFNDMMAMDNFALAFTGLMIVLTLAWFVLSPSYIYDRDFETDHYVLVIFSLIGAVTMVSYSNLLMLFLGIEIMSIPMYVLAGSRKQLLTSNEAALKYFLLGSFATGLFLFGIALIYGITGSFNLNTVANALAQHSGSDPMLIAGILMIMCAMLFKISAAPFHFWTPDVYQGSPTIITAFMSSVVKTASIAALLRLFVSLFGQHTEIWADTLWVIAALTILAGNLTAVFQKDVKRMLAFSSVSHAGYMLLAILAMNSSSAPSLLFYTAAYSISSIGSFAILLLINKSTGNDSIESFTGLARKNPFFAAATIIAMLSLAGIPPTAGFFAKYFIFSAAIQNGLTGLVLIAIVGSLIGVFYYFRIIIALFRDKEAPVIPITGSERAVLLFSSAAALLLGILPGLIAGLL